MFANQTSRVYCDAEDLNGGLNVLERRIAEADDERMRWACVGARAAIECVLLHRLNTQADFFAIFDMLLTNEIEKGN